MPKAFLSGLTAWLVAATTLVPGVQAGLDGAAREGLRRRDSEGVAAGRSFASKPLQRASRPPRSRPERPAVADLPPEAGVAAPLAAGPATPPLAPAEASFQAPPGSPRGPPAP